MIASIIILYALCASTFTLSKAILTYSQPLFYVGIRMLVAGILLYGYYRIRQKGPATIKPGDWHLFLQIVIFHIYIAYVFDLWALQFITSIESSVIYNFLPFVSAFFSYLWFNEVMTPKKWVGLAIGSASLIPVFINSDVSFYHSTQCVPVIVMLGAVASSAYGWILLRELVKNRNYSPIMVNGLGMIGGGIAALATSFGFESWSPLPITSWGPFIILTVAIIIVANFIFYNFYGYLLKYYTATFLAFAGFMCPLFAMLFGWFFLGETITTNFFYSVIAVAVGLYLFYQEELRQGYIKH